MSRALDHEVKEALKHGDYEGVFNEIAGALSQHLSEPLEIEFLSRSHPIDKDTIFLQDGACIAVPKLRLLQAFIFARRVLLEYLNEPEKQDPDQVLKATAVILLMDPEHLTATNTRKRLVLSIAIRNEANIDKGLQAERYYIDSLLTSRLHRHTKSPTLWNHRQWLMERFEEHGLELEAVRIMETIVLVAAERHPRNYYAWLHARYLVNKMTTDPADMQLQETLEASKKWAFSHHDDISGWAFLMFFLNEFPQHSAAVFAETLKLAVSFHWRNESVWYFLRNMLHQPAVKESHEVEFHSTRLALLKGAREDSDERRILDQALCWIES
ncbi:Protein prenyltransferase alpha subunit repeat-containing 1-like protein [Cladobotryum mycophilum]|uniref:Protein prenyltransferase alpha subunit repeat-containing 1-like protein n=1 Tax=Cladobotryum mycophilum TaxID=491253 RepID=A0ABR0SBW3_9HYPO